jgi:hypothetical protein
MPEPTPPYEVERYEGEVLYAYARSVKLFVRRLRWSRMDDEFIRQRVYQMVDVSPRPEHQKEICRRLKDTALVALEQALAEPTHGPPEECN